ncbi:MAG: hypothetical protein LBV34_01295 [Nocardiopsaceae bacterium]|jgi:hypothetical protein|nr:hypothetical protein [Nocardiopsaceae bacterium]
MLADLAALTPPLLVAIAFLVAAGAFIRHEMRRGKNMAEDEEADSSHDSSSSPDANESAEGSAQPSVRENASDSNGGQVTDR